MKQFTFKTITDTSEAEKAWRSLSPNKLLFDDWDFRYAYYKYFMYPLFFIAAYDADQLVGLLPLMWNEEKKYLEFFASFGYMENNSLYVKPSYESCIHQLITFIDRPALLEFMSPRMEVIPTSTAHDYEYYADVTGLKHYTEFIERNLSGDKKRNLESQFRRLVEMGVTIRPGTTAELDYLIYWSKVRFGAKSSFYRRPHFDEYIRYIGSHFDSRVLTATINEDIVGVGLVVLYNDMCFGISTGYNPEVSNLGKYLSMHKINIAIQEGKTIYAAGTGSPNWKEDFNLQKNSQYLLDLRNKYTIRQHPRSNHN